MDDWEKHFAEKTKRRAKQAVTHRRMKHLRRWGFPLAIAAICLFVVLVLTLYRP